MEYIESEFGDGREKTFSENEPLIKQHDNECCSLCINMGCGGSIPIIQTRDPIPETKAELANHRITLEQISEHNKKHRNSSVWSPMKGKVYDIRGMYASLSPHIQEACQQRHPNQCCGKILSRIESSPSTFLYLLATCKVLKVDKYLLEEAKRKNYIGTVKFQAEEDRIKDTNSHITYAIEGFNHFLNNKSGSDREYVQASLDIMILSQSSAKCQFKREVIYCDLTEESFVVPQGCDKETLRSFLYEDYPLSWSLVNASKTDVRKDKYPLDSLTLQDISDHNAGYRDTAVWMPIGDKVYDATGIYGSLDHIIKSKTTCIYDHDQIRCSIMGFYPSGSSFLLVLAECKMLKMGIRTLERAKQLHLVGKLKTETMKQHEDDFRIQIGRAIEGCQESLKNYPKKEGYVRSYLSASLQVYKNVAGRFPLLSQRIAPRGDLNEADFYLPEWFDAHTLRSYFTEDYTPFDTTLDPPEEQDWIYLWKPDDYVRDWLDTWELFDMTIEGEAAWSVIDTDIIRNDIATETQLKLIVSRDQRTDLNNKGRKKRRMRQLANYFVLKYEFNRERVLEKFNLWKVSLEENAEDLLTLVSNPRAIIKRRSFVSSPLPTPRVFTANMKNKMKQRRIIIAVYFYSKYKNKHHRLHMENESYSEHVLKWNWNLEENEKALLKLCDE